MIEEGGYLVHWMTLSVSRFSLYVGW